MLSIFKDTPQVQSVTIPESVTEILGEEPISSPALQAVYVSENNSVYCSIDGVLFSKDKTVLYQYPEAKSDVTTYVVPNGVQIIDRAFRRCNALVRVELPNSVTSIGRGAFSSCTSLESITIPSSVRSIGTGAFSSCISLASITIPDGVTSIENSAFNGCKSLTNITIPDSVRSIGSDAFYSCDSLTDITVETGNLNYSSENGVLFNKNKSELIKYPNGKTDAAYTVPNGVINITSNAFSECNFFTNVTIPTSVTSIEAGAFSQCDSLTSILIPDGVTSIGEVAFRYCDSLTSIMIPDSVSSIGGWAFSNTAYYDNKDNWDNDVLYIGSHCIDAITSISGNYIIKDGIKTIADSAFSQCISLMGITIPDSVTSIGSGAFAYCDSLTSITIPNSVTSIGDSAFYDTAYYNNADNWDNDVLYIGNHCIEANYNISGDYTIKAGTKTIADSAFSWCDSLTSITIPDSVTCIARKAFWDCDSLASITIPNSVTSIEDTAFYSCDSLESITIPNSVTSIGDRVYGWCTSLTGITVGSGNPNYSSVNGVLFDKNKTKLIQYPAGKTDTAYTVPSSVTRIEDDAFSNCNSLTSITIPDSVTSIGEEAFGWCSSDLTIYGYADSYAETYALENNIPFYAIELIEDTQTGVSVAGSSADVLPDNTQLTVEQIAASTDSVTYDITLTQNGVTVQPTGTVTVMIPVPDTMDGNACKVYRQEADGTYTDMNAVYQDGYMVFTTDHFSIYRLTGCLHMQTETKITAAPTCTEAGEQEIICTVCGKVIAIEPVPAKGHTLGEWVTTKEPTHTEEGERTQSCTVCGEVLATESIPMLTGLLGDVNVDGKVDAVDARWVLQAAAGMRMLENETAADVNGDGKIDAVDARWILQAAAGMRTL